MGAIKSSNFLGLGSGTGFVLNNSVYGDGSTGYFSRTPGVAPTSDYIKTISFLVKRTALSSVQWIYDAGSNNDQIQFAADDGLEVSIAATVDSYLEPTARFRDVSAFADVLVVYDTTQATASNRVKIYINGVQVTAFDNNTYPSLNHVIDFGANGVQQNILRRGNNSQFFPGYLARLILIDGQALTPSSFGETDATTGSWKPKAYTGTYGTNGFHLDFANGADLGNDVSGNNNDFTKTGTVTQTTDSPTDDAANNIGNFSVWNALRPSTSTLSNGNLTAAGTASTTIHVSQDDKWYWEITANAVGVTAGLENTAGTTYTQSVTNGSTTGFRYTHSTTTLEYTTDGTTYNTVSSAVVGTAFLYSTSASATLKNGSGSLSYTVPTGFKRLCTANLPAPAVKDSGLYHNVVTYTGTGATLSITGVGFQPDFVMIKSRSAATDWAIYDSTRGVQKRLESNTSDTEVTTDGGVTSFDADGFTLGTLAQVNTNTATYVAYCWKKGATPGFDIVGYAGSGVAQNISHVLGAVPKLIIAKRLDVLAADWAVYHASDNASPQGGYMVLNSTAAFAADATVWNNTAPTSSVFSVGTPALTNAAATNYIAYLWAEISGFSKFGSYTGNGSADGPFVYCGFRPKFILVKNTTTAGTTWHIIDTARETYNPSGDKVLYPHSNMAESTADGNLIDVLSNGFKLRSLNGDTNASSSTYIFAAFAEFPFGGLTTTQGKAR